MSLKADDTLQQLVARNEPGQQKNMLFLSEFGRYLEAVSKQPVYVCEKCLDVRLGQERNPEMLCFRSDDPHSWKEFGDEKELENYIRKNIGKHYARAAAAKP